MRLSKAAPAQGANLRLFYATKKLKNFKGTFPVAEVLNSAPSNLGGQLSFAEARSNGEVAP
jgi:hypothetical protein